MLTFSKKILKKISLYVKNTGMSKKRLSINCQNQYGSRFFAGLPRPFSYQSQINYAVLTPQNKFRGLGSFPFARRYLGNRCFFLFLRVLRCFSSPGSLPCVMDWRMGTWGLLKWVSPFGHPRLNGYLLLPAAFRSLSRPSSAPSA